MIPLPKSCNPQHIKENFEIFDFQLTKEEMEEIAKIHKNKPFYYFPDREQHYKRLSMYNPAD